MRVSADLGVFEIPRVSSRQPETDFPFDERSQVAGPQKQALKAPRKAVTSKPRMIEPNCYCGIDMTKIMIPVFVWGYLHVIIDWGAKKCSRAI